MKESWFHIPLSIPRGYDDVGVSDSNAVDLKKNSSISWKLYLSHLRTSPDRGRLPTDPLPHFLPSPSDSSVSRCIKTLQEQSSFVPVVHFDVHLDLWAANLIPDPLKDFNEITHRWIGLSDWTYTTVLDLIPGAPYLLIANGLDTICDVYFEDKLVLSARNKFTRHSVLLTPSKPHSYLEFHFFSPASSALELRNIHHEQYQYSIPEHRYMHSEPHRNFVRKSGCDFGWDWGGCFLPCGIWQDLVLVRLAPSFPLAIHSSDVNVSPCDGDPEEFKVTVGFQFKESSSETLPPSSSFSAWSGLSKPSFTLKIILEEVSPDGKVSPYFSDNQHIPFTEWLNRSIKDGDSYRFSMTVFSTLKLAPDKKPRLWNPRGFGPRNRYSLQVLILVKGNFIFLDDQPSLLYKKQTEIGFRRVKLLTEPDNDEDEDEEDRKNRPRHPNARSFQLSVNGNKIFCLGANIIPSSCFSSRQLQVKDLVLSAVLANFNCLRVWGGGVYPSDEFFELCNMFGIVVLMDFMFACALYPSSPYFFDLVREEVRQQSRRLASVPSLILWYGNNENEESLGYLEGVSENKSRFVSDYDRLNNGIIKETLRSVQSSIPFWPSSPSNGVDVWGDPTDQFRGDCHYWGVWHGGKTFDCFAAVKPRFCSEFGFQSLCSRPTLKTAGIVCDSCLSLSSPAQEFRQRSPLKGNVAIVSHVMNYFLLPKSDANYYDSMVYISQLLQAFSIQFAVENWRRLWPYCSGTLFWQLNDIWQGTTWSSVEFGGKWKALMYFARSFFEDPLVSCSDERNLLHNVGNLASSSSSSSPNVHLVEPDAVTCHLTFHTRGLSNCVRLFGRAWLISLSTGAVLNCWSLSFHPPDLQSTRRIFSQCQFVLAELQVGKFLRLARLTVRDAFVLIRYVVINQEDQKSSAGVSKDEMSSTSSASQPSTISSSSPSSSPPTLPSSSSSGNKPGFPDSFWDLPSHWVELSGMKEYVHLLSAPKYMRLCKSSLLFSLTNTPAAAERMVTATISPSFLGPDSLRPNVETDTLCALHIQCEKEVNCKLPPALFCEIDCDINKIRNDKKESLGDNGSVSWWRSNYFCVLPNDPARIVPLLRSRLTSSEKLDPTTSSSSDALRLSSESASSNSKEKEKRRESKEMLTTITDSPQQPQVASFLPLEDQLRYLSYSISIRTLDNPQGHRLFPFSGSGSEIRRLRREKESDSTLNCSCCEKEIR